MPDLIRHFFALVEREGLPAKQLDQAALDRLKRHRWPGNVRELENLARRLAALYPQETIAAAVIDAELSQPAMASADDEPRSEEGLSAAVERHLAAYFATFGDDLPPPGPLSPRLARDRASAPVGDARRHPRQPDPRRRPARRQPQHPAQEDPRSGHPGVPQQRVTRTVWPRQRWRRLCPRTAVAAFTSSLVKQPNSFPRRNGARVVK